MPWTFPTESFSLGGGKAGAFLIGSIGDSHFYQAFFLPRDHLAAKAWERRLECTQREEFHRRSSAQSLSPPFSSSTFILLHVCLICAVPRMSYAYLTISAFILRRFLLLLYCFLPKQHEHCSYKPRDVKELTSHAGRRMIFQRSSSD